MSSGVIFKLDLDPYITMALREDISWGDVSTEATGLQEKRARVQLMAKGEGILCGLEVFRRVFTLLEEESSFETPFKDGDRVEKGQLIGVVRGKVETLLSGERTALNYLQRMSGIATLTRTYSDILKPYKTVLLDTRKTTPNMRIFEKYAVRVGGGKNHRYNLSDGVMLKDNHIDACGSITEAVKRARAHAPFVRKIEVETENLDMVAEALEAGADIIMLDNMDNETMKKALALIGGRAETECSGNITQERLREIGEIGVDYVSSGAITYGAPVLDLSMKHLTVERET
ncbi:MAG: carboxylating nicotinate-nucleotide diphosphorylase [Tissierellia bacterium]|nr:carboxylating nicotinate-nucleotide diphosphorylase [Tissierellia bacterium]